MVPITNLLGAIGETRISTDLMLRGFTIYSPLHEGGAIDMIAFKGNKLYRIQAKYKRVNVDGVVEISWKGGASQYVSSCDILAIYVPEMDTVYYVPTSICGSNKAKKVFHLDSSNADSITFLPKYIDFPEDIGLIADLIAPGSLPSQPI